MISERRPPYPLLRRLAALAYAFLIFGLGVADLGRLPVPPVALLDKLEHLLAFGAFVWVIELALLELGTRRRRTLAVLVSCSCGLVLELVQSALPHRSAEALDLVADVLGALIAAALSFLASRLVAQRGNATEPPGTRA